MRRLTASKAGLAIECSFWLHDHVPLDTSPAGPAADEGTAVHALIENDIRGGDGAVVLPPLSPDGALRVEAKFTAWKAWAKKERRIGWRPEVAYAYDPSTDTARELVQRGHRDYSGVKPGEVAMQLDVVTMGADADGPLAEVIDWKTGRDVEPALTNGQLGVAALAVSRVMGVDRVRVRLVYIGEDGVHEDSAVLEALDLDMVRHHMRRVVGSPDTTPKPGPHCSGMYCNARHQCPAIVGDMAQLVNVPPADMRTLVAGALVTPEDAGFAHVRLRAIKDAVAAVEERIKSIVETHGSAPTAGGKVLRLVPATRTNVNGKKALVMLREMGAAETALSELTTESNYVSLKECAR